jgi:hypothetical protein
MIIIIMIIIIMYTYLFIYSFIYLFTCILLDRVIAQDWPCQGGGNPSDKMYPTFEMGYRWV